MERLTAMDLMAIWPEERGWSDDIGALAILDGGSLLDGEGRLQIEAVREHIGRRLHLVPRFRQLLYRPRLGLGWRCGSTPQPWTWLPTLACWRWKLPPIRDSFCWRARSCDGGRCASHAHRGR